MTRTSIVKGFLKKIVIISIVFSINAYALEPSLLPTSPNLTVTAPVSSPTINTTPNSDKLSLNFQNIEIRTLLQLIGKTSGLNFVISDAVKGTTTLNLENVTWREALEIVLQSHGLASRKIGNAVFISTADDINQNQTKELQSAQAIANLAPLKSIIIRLKYTNSLKLQEILKGKEGSALLTPRGQVGVDSRTNSIIVRDVATNLVELVKFIKKLDIPARQVSIEARIVNMDITYEAQLGVRFGLSNTKSLSGTLPGANQLAQGINVANVTPIDQRLNFNVPAALLSTGTNPASIGLALARLGPVLLDLELSALEEEGHTQIISKPRVVTTNQQKAVIETGQQIPYQEATSSGATSISFIKAVLSLVIIPQITPDNKIILRIKASQDSVGQPLVIAQQQVSAGSTITVPTAFGPPTINTQDVESYVLLENNETVVIGGIYQITKSNTLDRVPFFSDIPFFGRLFNHRAIKNNKQELLIFVTPKIIEKCERVE